MSLLYKTAEDRQRANKAQCRQAWKLVPEIKRALSDWFLAEFELPAYSGSILAEHIAPRVINEWVSRVSASAPDVYINDTDIIKARLVDCQIMAEKMDSENLLEKILGEETNREEFVKHGGC
jgi:hypothetical protein